MYTKLMAIFDISTLWLIVYDISSWLQVYDQNFDEYSGTNAYIGQRFNGYVYYVAVCQNPGTPGEHQNSW